MKQAEGRRQQEEAAGEPPDPLADLEGLRAEHGRIHAIGRDDGRWVAASRDGTGPELRRASVAALDMALRISRGAAR
jgi:hypothetical protein